MSPQALSRHLRVLRRAGLVSEHGIESDARVRIYSVHAAAFQPVQDWMAQVEDCGAGSCRPSRPLPRIRAAPADSRP